MCVEVGERRKALQRVKTGLQSSRNPEKLTGLKTFRRFFLDFTFSNFSSHSRDACLTRLEHGISTRDGYLCSWSVSRTHRKLGRVGVGTYRHGGGVARSVVNTFLRNAHFVGHQKGVGNEGSEGHGGRLVVVRLVLI